MLHLGRVAVFAVLGVGRPRAAEDRCFNVPIPRSRLVWVFGLRSARDAGYWGVVRVGAPWRQAWGSSAVDVFEDLADQVGISHIRYDPQLAATERAVADVNFKDTLQSLGPGQWRGGWIIAVAA